MIRTGGWIVALLLAVCLLGAGGGTAWAQKDKDKPTRSVKGAVTTESEDPVDGAIVQLKNTRTLQVKSFITDAQGKFYFHGLDPNVDYKLQARADGMESRVRTVSTFDDRAEIVYNLELKPAK